MSRRIVAVAVALTLSMAACGGDAVARALTADEQAFADSMATRFSAEADAGEPLAGDDAAACLAEGLVREFGMDRLVEFGVGESGTDAFLAMTDDELDTVAAVAFGCPQFSTFLVAEMSADGLSAASAECLVGEMIESGVARELLAADIRGESMDAVLADPTNQGILIGAMLKCFTAEEREQLLGG